VDDIFLRVIARARYVVLAITYTFAVAGSIAYENTPIANKNPINPANINNPAIPRYDSVANNLIC
jgi:hypothetical protein